jgi:hypothetical protein
MTQGITLSDLGRDPADVARERHAWHRGEPEEAVVETLVASGARLYESKYTCWVWAGRTADGTPAWALPVETELARGYERGVARVLVRSLTAAADAGADPEAMTLRDWHGYTCLVLPDLDEELAAPALEEAHPRPGRAALAELPPEVVLGGPRIPLAPLAPRPNEGLMVLAAAARVHPVRAALALLARGQRPDEPSYPAEMVERLREWGCEGPAAPAAEPLLDIDDDPCPRRQHARRVLQRLLRMGKVGEQHHTEFEHLYRGAAPENRRMGLEVGEALLRAGLLAEKPSVGQRHVYLRREALPDIHALIERGATPDPGLAAEWTRPAPEDADPPDGAERSGLAGDRAAAR